MKSKVITRQQFLRTSGRLILGGLAATTYTGLTGCSPFGGSDPNDVVIPPSGAAEGQVTTNRIKVSTIGAPDLAKTEDWYGEWLDYAVIERGTLEDQRVLHGTLATIVDQATRTPLRPPAMVIAGEVVRFLDREEIARWIDSREESGSVFEGKPWN